MSDGGDVWSYILGAYIVTWAGLIGYALRLWILNRRARAVAGELGGGDA